jgi:hypothetical protein
MHSPKSLYIVLFLILAGFSCFAQQSILSSTGNSSGTGGSVSYSIGQVAFSQHTGINGVVTEGVQQPYEIQIMEGIEQGQGINLDCILYPNPADAQIKLKIENIQSRVLTYQLLNMEGLILRNGNIENVETLIQMDNLASATYFLTVSERDKSVKTFKIIKK